MIPGIVAQAMPGVSGGEGDGTTELLLSFDGPDGSTVFYDSGRHALPVGFRGAAQIDTDQSKFGGSSYFGAGDTQSTLFIPPVDGIHFDAGPFTVEFWIRPTSGTLSCLMGQRVADARLTRSWSLFFLANRRIELLASPTEVETDDVQLASTTQLALNAWHHIAMDRDEDGIIRVYLNGVMEITTALLPSFKRLPIPLTIGNLAAPGVRFPGWIDEVRIVKGAAMYGSDDAFAPPTSPFPKPIQELDPGDDPYFDNVLLLVGFDGRASPFAIPRDDSLDHRKVLFKAGNSNTLTDTAYNTDLLSAVGGRQAWFTQNTLVSWEGPASDFAMGTDPFTAEVWVRQTVLQTSCVFGQREGTSGTSWAMMLLSDGRIEINFSDTTNTNTVMQSDATRTTAALSSNSAPALGGRVVGNWDHIAMDRDALGVFRLFVNGFLVRKEIGMTTKAIREATNSLIGMGLASNYGFLSSYWIDELRVTRGVSRYGSDAMFSIPDSVFPRNQAAKPTIDAEIVLLDGFKAVGDRLRAVAEITDGWDLTYQWRRDGVNIGGATGRTYRLVVGDAGADIDVRVSGWNYAGTTTVTATGVGPIDAAPSYTYGALAPHGDMQSGTDRLIPAGDMQTGADTLLWKERIS